MVQLNADSGIPTAVCRVLKTKTALLTGTSNTLTKGIFDGGNGNASLLMTIKCTSIYFKGGNFFFQQ